jgi:hypothetical protein
MVHVACARFYFRVVLDSVFDNEYFMFGSHNEQNHRDSTKKPLLTAIVNKYCAVQPV